jgi:hypothetical protein
VALAIEANPPRRPNDRAKSQKAKATESRELSQKKAKPKNHAAKGQKPKAAFLRLTGPGDEDNFAPDKKAFEQTTARNSLLPEPGAV